MGKIYVPTVLSSVNYETFLFYVLSYLFLIYQQRQFSFSRIYNYQEAWTLFAVVLFVCLLDQQRMLLHLQLLILHHYSLFHEENHRVFF
jgi:hypothetical protein